MSLSCIFFSCKVMGDDSIEDERDGREKGKNYVAGHNITCTAFP